MASPTRAGLVTDEDLAEAERMPVDAFGRRFHDPAPPGLVQIADHVPTVDRGADSPWVSMHRGSRLCCGESDHPDNIPAWRCRGVARSPATPSSTCSAQEEWAKST